MLWKLIKRTVFSNARITRMMSFYAVACGRAIGVYNSWKECEEQVKGFKGAKYKKFPTRSAAEDFIRGGEAIENEICNFQSSKKKFLKGCIGDVTTSAAKTDKEFWPINHDDEGDITENDLLYALAEVEGTSKSPNRLKRKSGNESGSAKIRKIEPIGIKQVGPYEFQINEEGYILAYTDGSCFNNGGKNASAGFGVYFGDNHPLNVAEPVTGRVTNNVGEIQAAIYAVKTAQKLGINKLCISTDSQFLINAVTLWIKGWKAKNWHLKSGDRVKNEVDFKELDNLLQDQSLDVKWNYVKAHKGIKGNEMADKLAKTGAEIYKRVFLGKMLNY
ncbi:ribonuclease H1 [Glossina fuscipes]|uniref:Ribonuclease H1 n=1 Tax=Glossina fuscipes TaxID=7396 RepID=A0A9C5Z2T2_9MUSC|nr:ribonuclease H1 [Glossina fuscipes]